MDQELTDLKGSVNLVEYAAGQGYWVDKQKSCRRSTVMRHDNGDKIVLSRNPKCWMYFSTRSDSDNGTIIDFIQNRQGQNIGQIKKQLRQWLGRPESQRVETKYKKLNTQKRNPESVRRYIESTSALSNSAYLQSRHIPACVIFGERFCGTICQDRRGNSVFLHRNAGGLCGAELKNHHFTGCPKDSLKGIWHSRLYPTDRRIIFCESGIDALSYHVLRGMPFDRYISLAGNFSLDQQKINDGAGHRYAQTIEAMVAKDKTFQRDIPTQKNWNDDLKALHQSKERTIHLHRPSMLRV
jgi:hypothetical protein